MRIAIVAVVLLTNVASASTDEEKVEINDLPKAVLSAVKAKFPDAKVTGAARGSEAGKVTFEVALVDDDTKIDVAVSAKGKILEVEKTVEEKKLPKAVTSALADKYPKAKIKKAEEIVKYEENEDNDKKEKDERASGEKVFEIVLAVPGKGNIEVKLSPAGKILETEDDDENDKDDEKDADTKKGKD